MKADRIDPVVASFVGPIAARRAIESLLSAGVNRENITVISSVPLDELQGAESEKAAVMPWLVALGAILGGIAGYLLVSLTQMSYPIATGGMPIVSLWTDGIIIYELTMLGAILSTLLVLCWTAPLLRWKRQPLDRPVDGEDIVLEIVPPTAELQERVRIALQNRTPESEARERRSDTGRPSKD